MTRRRLRAALRCIDDSFAVDLAECQKNGTLQSLDHRLKESIGDRLDALRPGTEGAQVDDRRLVGKQPVELREQLQMAGRDLEEPSRSLA
jgi:hypothetical protein